MKRFDRRPCAGCSELSEGVLCESCRKQWESAVGEFEYINRRVPDELDSLSFCVGYDVDIPDALPRRLLLSAKNNRDKELSALFASYLYAAVKDGVRLIPSETVVVNVPRSKIKVINTGTDQAKEVALSLAERLGAEYVEAFVNTGGKVEQKSLPVSARVGNAVGSYRVKPDMIPRIISKICVLVDDICTTGATLNACAALLRDYGAKRVEGAVVAVSRSLYIRHRKG